MSYRFSELARETRRALLSTAYFETRKGEGTKKVYVSDQMRRILALVNELTFEGGRPGVWIHEKRDLARALSMDPSDCYKALDKLVDFEVVWLESKDDGFWLELRTAKLCCSERVVNARAAITDLEGAHFSKTHQPNLIPPSVEEGRNYGFDAALEDARATADRKAILDTAAGSGAAGGLGSLLFFAEPKGNLPVGSEFSAGTLPVEKGESPRYQRGISPLEEPPKGTLPAEAKGESPRWTVARVTGTGTHDRSPVTGDCTAAPTKDRKALPRRADTEIMDELRRTIGETAWSRRDGTGKGNYGALWQTALRSSPEAPKAAREALASYKTAAEPIHNAGGYLWRTFTRIHTALRKAAIEAGRKVRGWML